MHDGTDDRQRGGDNDSEEHDDGHATVAADIAACAPGSGAPHAALAAAQEETRAALLVLADVPHRYMDEESCLLAAAAPAPGRMDRGHARAMGHKPRILVVEDEWFIATEIAECLQDAGMEVLGPASNVPHALRLIETAATDGDIAAAVLDVNLRGVPVTPVADALAAIGVPVLYATGYSAKHVRGGHDEMRLLEKPFNRDALLRGLRALGAT